MAAGHTCHTAPDLLSLMPARLHAGEVERITLARQLGADFLLLDDNATKKTARYLGLRVLGTLGVLVTAKRAGPIDAVDPVLADLQDIGFFASERVLDMTRRAAGE